MQIFSLSPHGLDFKFVTSFDEEGQVSWIGIEEMSAEPIDFDFEDRLLAEIDADRHFGTGPMDGDLDDEDFDDDWDDGYFGYPLSEEEFEQLVAEEATELLQLELEAADKFQPRFGSGYSKRKVRNEDTKLDSERSKAHTADRGWRRHALKKRHGRDSIRTLPVWAMPRYNAMHYLTDNARMNLH